MVVENWHAVLNEKLACRYTRSARCSTRLIPVGLLACVFRVRDKAEQRSGSGAKIEDGGTN